MKTSVTEKFQTTIPKKVREVLGVKKGEEVEWHVVNSMVVVHRRKKIDNPVKVLTSQIKGHMDVDMVKLVRQVREE